MRLCNLWWDIPTALEVDVKKIVNTIMGPVVGGMQYHGLEIADDCHLLS